MGDKNLFLGPMRRMGFFLKGVEKGGATLGKSFLFFPTENKKRFKANSLGSQIYNLLKSK
jgi:hypothetical protein